VAEPSGNPPGPPVRRTHAAHACTLRIPAKTPLTGDNMDAPAACAVPFCPYCGDVVMRTRNVSEYMLVLALCLVVIVLSALMSPKILCSKKTQIRKPKTLY